MAELKYKTGNLNNLTPHQIDDLVNTTMEYLIGKGKFTNLLSDLNDYVAVRELMARHKKTFEGGMDWTFNVAITANNKGNGTAKTTKLFGTDSSTRVDAIKKGKVSPRYITANYVYDVREPVLNSGSMVQRIDYVKEQMNLMYQSYYDLMEGLFWGEPADKDVDPAGIKYWLLPATSDTGMGSFEPVNPTAGARAGIDSTTNARWANWSARYAAVSKDDLVKKMRYAARKTTFRSPLTVGEPKLGSGRGIYVGIDTLTELEDLLEKQNMNLGNDLAAKDGKTLFKGNPVYHVPYLDSDATAPLYMIDWSTLQLGILAGWDKKVSKPTPVADMHTVRQVFLDTTANFVCTNLRNQAVISKAAAA
jgi:hypothetical protein